MDEVPDALSRWERYDAEQQAMLEDLPECCFCGKTIQDEHLWEILGDVYCEECAENQFRRRTEERRRGRW